MPGIGFPANPGRMGSPIIVGLSGFNTAYVLQGAVLVGLLVGIQLYRILVIPAPGAFVVLVAPLRSAS